MAECFASDDSRVRRVAELLRDGEVVKGPGSEQIADRIAIDVILKYSRLDPTTPMWERIYQIRRTLIANNVDDMPAHVAHEIVMSLFDAGYPPGEPF